MPASNIKMNHCKSYCGRFNAGYQIPLAHLSVAQNTPASCSAGAVALESKQSDSNTSLFKVGLRCWNRLCIVSQSVHLYSINVK